VYAQLLFPQLGFFGMNMMTGIQQICTRFANTLRTALMHVLVGMFISTTCLVAQELYPSTEAASNSPKDVLRLRAMTMYVPTSGEAIFGAKAMYSVTDKLMLVGTVNTSSWLAEGFPTPFKLYTPVFRSTTLYAKYRLFSEDAPHQHIRLAAFAEFDYAPNTVSFVSYTEGIKNGATAGGIGTVLLNRTALSATASYFLPVSLGGTTGLDGGVFNYSLSVGHLVLPERYTAYSEVNLNVYCEFLGYLYTPSAAQHAHLDANHPPINNVHYFNRLDIAPAVQLIFNSQAKLDFSLRTQLLDEYHTYRHWMATLAFEWYFF
jgi:hypothetical protein